MEAVYSLKTLSLIKKFRYSQVNYAQDDGFCFSADGKYFINIERQGDDLHSAISVYDTAGFSRVSQFLLGDIGMLEDIEQVDGELYVIGFWRNSDLIITENFVAKYTEGKISEPVNITKNEYEYYNELLLNKKKGDNVKNHTLATLWRVYST